MESKKQSEGDTRNNQRLNYSSPFLGKKTLLFATGVLFDRMSPTARSWDNRPPSRRRHFPFTNMAHGDSACGVEATLNTFGLRLRR